MRSSSIRLASRWPPDDRSFCYVDGGRLYYSSLTSLRPRQVYQAPEGYRPTGLSMS